MSKCVRLSGRCSINLLLLHQKQPIHPLIVVGAGRGDGSLVLVCFGAAKGGRESIERPKMFFWLFGFFFFLFFFVVRCCAASSPPVASSSLTLCHCGGPELSGLAGCWPTWTLWQEVWLVEGPFLAYIDVPITAHSLRGVYVYQQVLTKMRSRNPVSRNHGHVYAAYYIQPIWLDPEPQSPPNSTFQGR